MDRIPVRIQPCPIHEVVAELRFEGGHVSDAMVGLALAALNQAAPKVALNVHALPIADLPRQIRASEIDLKYKPTHRIVGDEFPVQVGPNVISVTCGSPYPGWGAFSSYFRSAFERVQKMGVAQHPIRLGLRYTNFFDHDVYDIVSLRVTHPDLPIPGEAMSIQARIVGDQVDSTLQVANNALIATGGGIRRVSALDIDTYVEETQINRANSVSAEFERLHTEEKRVFYSLLLASYVETLSPEYE